MKTLNDLIIELWHISRTALAGQECTRYDRMIYVKKELLRSYPEKVAGMGGKSIWFAIEAAISHSILS